MKILIDNQVYDSQNFGGVSRYFNELRSGNNFIQKMDAFVDDASNYSKIYKKIQRKFTRTFFTQSQSLNKKNNFYISQLQNQQFDIFHPTYYDNYFLPYLNNPFVITIHDMIHEKYAEYFGNSFDSINKRRLCEKATKIIAVSNTTKKDIIDIFNVSEEKIEVIYHGTNFNSIIEVKPNFDIESDRYLLYTGTRQNYKNFFTFIVSVAPLLKEFKDLHLICTGSEFNVVEKRWIKDLDIEGKVKSYFCVTDNELLYLYKNAECFVFPSLYEGFGFPILEAFSANCPVVTSNGGSLKEIASNAAIYFNPKDIKEMRESVYKVISDRSLKTELVNLGKIRLNDFSWDKCRFETNLLYSKAIEKNKL